MENGIPVVLEEEDVVIGFEAGAGVSEAFGSEDAGRLFLIPLNKDALPVAECTGSLALGH